MSSRLRRRPVAAAAVVTAAALALTGCGSGFDAATNVPYVPADGASLDTETVKLRNVYVTADEGRPVALSATLVNLTDAPDSVVGVTIGEAPGFEGSITGPGVEDGELAVPRGTPVIVGVESGPQVAFAGASPQPGSWVPITVVTATGGEASGQVLVRRTVTPEPTAPADTSDDPVHAEPEH